MLQELPKANVRMFISIELIVNRNLLVVENVCCYGHPRMLHNHLSFTAHLQAVSSRHQHIDIGHPRKPRTIMSVLSCKGPEHILPPRYSSI